MSPGEFLVRQNKWDIRFLRLAREVSTWSKDSSTQVGAVITDKENRVVSLGYNGLPRAIPDSDDILLDRTEKYETIIHAEMNALLFTTRPPAGCTIYTYPLPPCSRCASVIIQAGIRTVVSVVPSPEILERWKDSLARATNLYSTALTSLRLIAEDKLSRPDTVTKPGDGAGK